jgi:hypothetical protein
VIDQPYKAHSVDQTRNRSSRAWSKTSPQAASKMSRAQLQEKRNLRHNMPPATTKKKIAHISAKFPLNNSDYLQAA